MSKMQQFTLLLRKKKMPNNLLIFSHQKLRFNLISFNTFKATYIDRNHNIIYSVLSVDTKCYQLPKYHPLSLQSYFKIIPPIFYL